MNTLTNNIKWELVSSFQKYQICDTIGYGVDRANMAKISKSVINKRIKLVYLIPLANIIKWKMITGVNSTHICDGLALWESDEKIG